MNWVLEPRGQGVFLGVRGACYARLQEPEEQGAMMKGDWQAGWVRGIAFLKWKEWEVQTTQQTIIQLHKKGQLGRRSYHACTWVKTHMEKDRNATWVA